MYRIVCVLLLNLFLICGVSAADVSYHKVQAKKGDGVYSILRKYKLVDEYCNISQFYKLNKLKKDAKLLTGKSYFIPILVYSYNGKNIRSSISKDDYDLALGVQKYNETMLANGLRKSSYRNDNQLWVPFSTLYCQSSSSSSITTEPEVAKIGNEVSSVPSAKEKTPSNTPSPKTQNFKIDNLFGKTYQKYEEVDQALKDKVFYLVSGHGGPDPGAMCTTCPSNLCEDEYAYDVALRLARNLRQHGAVVEMIIQDQNDGIRDEQYLKCDRDERCNNRKLPLNQKARLQQRAVHINNLHAKYKKKGYKDHSVVVIHVDAAGKGARKDVFFYHHKNSKRGKEMAYNIHNTFQSKYDKFQKGRGYKGTISHRGLYMVNNTNPPIVYIELANIQNPQDQKRILLNSNRQALANWIFQGLIK
jgi:N-acetylmuramoyl-L-alanine amidase